MVILQPIQKYKRLIEKVSGAHARITFDVIIGNSTELNYALRLAEVASKSDSNVLLLGESGVGKEMFAQAIHNASNRRDEPFFAINCAALPRELISSELFGYEEGAFTGARKEAILVNSNWPTRGPSSLTRLEKCPLICRVSVAIPGRRKHYAPGRAGGYTGGCPHNRRQ